MSSARSASRARPAATRTRAAPRPGSTRSPISSSDRVRGRRRSRPTPAYPVSLYGAARDARLVEQLLQHLVGLGADDAIPAGDEGRDAGHTPLARFRPIGIDRTLEAAFRQYRLRFLAGKPDGAGELDQDHGIADVPRGDEIGLVDGMVNRLAAQLRTGPSA